jgi:stearoyl-CoA desaturase (delta-9 desaturase)
MLLYLLVVTQITIFTVTLYLHRSQAHRGVDFHPVVAHFFRFWSWLTTSMVTREWVAIHRKHHAKCETEEDPHSPMHKGIGTVFWRGADLYRQARLRREDIEQYGKGCPDDWIERHLYTRHANLGVGLQGRCCVGDPDGVDPVLGCRRHQWPRPLVGLPQLRDHRHRHQPDPVGGVGRW